jgi:O-antigen ligase
MCVRDSYFPFYVEPVLKPVFHYRFSPVEIFTLLTFAAFVLSRLTHYVSSTAKQRPSLHAPRSTSHALRSTLHRADYAVLAFTAVATLSLLFTERLDVASNEWRMVILEPALFYFLLRGINPREREMWTILDAFVLGGLVVALYGLWQYGFQQEELITAEGGLLRLRSIYGSPNNVALYLGRILPLLAAMALIGGQHQGGRRWAYTAALLPVSLAILLTFSKGGLFVGLPAAFLFVFWRWQKAAGRRTWPWLIGLLVLGLLGISLAQQIPALAGRLNLRGATGDFRINLWRAGLNMLADHPLFGVGLDNFLYAYRGRYIFESAWQEPNLSHPHNIVLDFATRLGLFGLLAGGWMLWALAGTLWAEQQYLARSEDRLSITWRPVAIGLGGAFVAMLAHGLVDHSFFLVDLAFTFYLMLGITVWLQNRRQQAGRISGKLSQQRPRA